MTQGSDLKLYGYNLCSLSFHNVLSLTLYDKCKPLPKGGEDGGCSVSVLPPNYAYCMMSGGDIFICTLI